VQVQLATARLQRASRRVRGYVPLACSADYCASVLQPRVSVDLYRQRRRPLDPSPSKIQGV